MAEVVGVVAAAAQLATASLSLLDMMRKIKGGSRTLQNYNQNLQELHSLSNSISQNPLLQTPEIGVCTESILSILEANSVSSLIQKNRWLRSWALISKDKDLQDTFVILEQRKASLSLVIEHLQAAALHEIQSDIKTMSRTPSTPIKTFNDAPPIECLDQRSDQRGQLQLAAEPSAPTTTGVTLHQTPTQEAPKNETSERLEDDAYNESLRRAFHKAMQTRDERPECDSMYFRCEAGSGSTQVNGHSIIGNAANASNLTSNIQFDGNAAHIGTKKTGDGRQINGLCLSLKGSLIEGEKLSMPVSHMTWVGVVCDGPARQINANVIESLDY